MRRYLAALSMLLCVAACTAGKKAAPPSPSPSPEAISTACPAGTQIEASPGEGLPAREGAGTGATLWALFFPNNGRMTVAEDNKIVWRMTGSGDFAIEAAGPGGRTVKPVWLEPHEGSSFRKPGQEWGTGWRFSVGGCWTFKATRTEGSGELTVRVAG